LEKEVFTNHATFHPLPPPSAYPIFSYNPNTFPFSHFTAFNPRSRLFSCTISSTPNRPNTSRFITHYRSFPLLGLPPLQSLPPSPAPPRPSAYPHSKIYPPLWLCPAPRLATTPRFTPLSGFAPPFGLPLLQSLPPTSASHRLSGYPHSKVYPHFSALPRPIAFSNYNFVIVGASILLIFYLVLRYCA
jgi:hypothetical protein